MKNIGETKPGATLLRTSSSHPVRLLSKRGGGSFVGGVCRDWERLRLEVMDLETGRIDVLDSADDLEPWAGGPAEPRALYPVDRFLLLSIFMDLVPGDNDDGQNDLVRMELDLCAGRLAKAGLLESEDLTGLTAAGTAEAERLFKLLEATP
jgi:hypothetical protein